MPNGEHNPPVDYHKARRRGAMRAVKKGSGAIFNLLNRWDDQIHWTEEEQEILQDAFAVLRMKTRQVKAAIAADHVLTNPNDPNNKPPAEPEHTEENLSHLNQDGDDPYYVDGTNGC